MERSKSSIKRKYTDYVGLNELFVLTNMESYNAVLISKGINQKERIIELRKLAKTQLMTVFVSFLREETTDCFLLQVVAILFASFSVLTFSEYAVRSSFLIWTLKYFSLWKVKIFLHVPPALPSQAFEHAPPPASCGKP